MSLSEQIVVYLEPDGRSRSPSPLQGSTVATTPVDHIREPTSCTLVFLNGRQNTVMEVAMAEHHNNKILPDYTRVEVHTVKPEFMQWRIDSSGERVHP